MLRDALRAALRDQLRSPFAGAPRSPILDLDFRSEGTTLPASNLATFTRASIATRETYDPTTGIYSIVPVSSGQPRLGTWAQHGGAKGILVEPTATNLFNESGDIGGGTWGTIRSSLASGVDTAPDGTESFAAVNEDGTAANSHFIQKNYSATSGQTYTASVFFKASNRSWIMMRNQSSPVTGRYFNVSNGTVGVGTSGTGSTPDAFGVVDYGGGIYQCWIEFTATATGTQTIVIFIASADNVTVFDGLNQESVLAWGSEVKPGKLSSYVPTTTTTVTRSDEVLNYPVVDLSTGSIVISFAQPKDSAVADRTLYQYWDGTTSERHRAFITASEVISAQTTDGGVLQASLTSGALTAGTLYTAAYSWATDDFEFFVDEASQGTDVSGTVPSGLDEIEIGNASGGSQLNGVVQRVSIWNEPGRFTH